MLVKASDMMALTWKASTAWQVCWGWEEAEAREVSLEPALATQ